MQERQKIVGLADRFATWIVVIALSAAALTWLFTGQIIRAVTILVVSAPALWSWPLLLPLWLPFGNATKHGFLVREGDALEKLAKVSKITFDKTGTLTCGTQSSYRLQRSSRLLQRRYLPLLCRSRTALGASSWKSGSWLF